ncbi:MAG: aminopeptidase P N-terminal domain-containing protein [Microbacteriaceae bacterium]|jgi:Xaa-Pro aminopeptidase|nr:aminopeptidase P N-terminal domain-containing protein [Microbacteriaceae bacterium]MCI1207283.1 aminopeptidase P N-terminal domain-containing protein [Microbacteriaceae bacterium]
MTRPDHDPFAAFLSTGWAAPPPGLGRKNPLAAAAAAHRAALLRAFPSRALLIPAGWAPRRSNDTFYRFRPGTAFTQLTGWGSSAREGSVLLLSGGQATLFCAERGCREDPSFFTDPAHGEFWVGPEAAHDELAAELELRVLPLPRLAAELPEHPLLLRGVDAGLDPLIPADPPEEARLRTVLDRARLRKAPAELAELRAAIADTLAAFEAVLRALPGAAAHPAGERRLEAAFDGAARVRGNGVGYGSIVAAGADACILHWSRNSGPVRPGDLVLLDAGVERNSLYTADVTRTFPVSGRFSPAQRRVYDAVLAAADAAFAVIGPGTTLRRVHETALGEVASAVRRWGLLSDIDPALHPHRRFMLHGTSHHLGLDVHDCGEVPAADIHDRPLEPGMVVTIEPGIYLRADDLLVPPELRGIGIRIEDDILITETGAIRLTEGFPRRARDVEAWVRTLGETRETGSEFGGLRAEDAAGTPGVLGGHHQGVVRGDDGIHRRVVPGALGDGVPDQP